jgi:DNA polymerase I
MKKQLILVDGSSYLFRAYHALPYLSNSEGKPSGAIIGVLNMLRKLRNTYSTKYICIIFDAKGKNFRHDIYPAYKANRKETPDDLSEQIQPLKDIIQALGYPLISKPNVEADDVIGTLTRVANQEPDKWNVLISTGDKDMAQLVNRNVSLIDTMKNKVSSVEDVFEKFGVYPNQIIDYLALIGDTSDNIPGIPKVGPKTASKWLKEYNNIAGIVENAKNIKGKVGENLRNNIDLLPLSYKLATIDCNLELNYDLNDLYLNSSNKEYLIQQFSYYGFAQLLNEWTQKENITQKIKKKYTCIITREQLDELIIDLSQEKLISIDTETTSLDPMQAELVGIAICYKPDIAFYIPLSHKYEEAPQQIDISYALSKLKPILESEGIHKVGQNIKYDIKIFYNIGIYLKGIKYDTMLESYIYNSTATRHNLNDLAKKYLNHNCLKFEDIAGKGKNQLTFDQITVEKATTYAAEDADITLQLHNLLWDKIQKKPSLEKLFLEVEMPVMYAINNIEINGIQINKKALKEQSINLEKQLHILEDKAYILAQEKFNLASAKQLREILFEKLHLPIVHKTPGGVASTSEDVLKELAINYELPSIIMEHRHLSKLKNTYIDKLPKMINLSTDRVHTSYHQAIAITGRLSSSDPNLQNIPVRTQEGRRIRKSITAKNGHKIISADYSQVELRIMAHLSGDPTLINAFKNKQDIHSATAAEIFNKAMSSITTEDRRKAKAVNFGLIYGMSAFGLAKQLQIPRNEAQEYIDIYFQRYPKVLDYMNQKKSDARINGYVETIFGRRLYLPNINSKNISIRRAAERVSINAPMQGSAADIIKKAMIAINRLITNNNDLKLKVIMQVHDELVFEVNKDQQQEAIKYIKELMENTTQLSVPLTVDIGSGDNWCEAH